MEWVKHDHFEVKTKINISDITSNNRKEVLQRELSKIRITIFAEDQI